MESAEERFVITSSYGATLYGIEPLLVTIEIHLQRGLPKFEMIGLAKADVKEGKNRILSALQSVGVAVKAKRIVANLAPASIKKEGALLDVPIALSLLASLGTIPFGKVEKVMAIGELSLNGNVRPVRGTLLMAHFARELGFQKLIVPAEAYPEVRGVDGIEILTPTNLLEIVEYFRSEKAIAKPAIVSSKTLQPDSVDWSEVGGQHLAKRALEVAASGRHNVLLSGPPGIGKSLLAHRFRTLLPSPSATEWNEISRIYSVLGPREVDRLGGRSPYRAPHHHASVAGLVGGGNPFLPGDFTLAHNGVLFMDELPEFRRDIVESLREPLQDGYISVARTSLHQKLPARFIFIGAMNLCPCGAMGDPKKYCECTPPAIEKFRQRVSEPVKDRIDLWISLPKPALSEVLSVGQGERSEIVRSRVEQAYRFQFERNGFGVYNSNLVPKQIQEISGIQRDARAVFEKAVEHFSLSARSVHKVLTIARTIADMERSPVILARHIVEALNYRSGSVVKQ